MPAHYNPQRHHRRSIRLKGYDYAAPGAYFVTIVAQNRERLFGEMAGDDMRLNDAGRIVQTVWDELPTHFAHVSLDAFVIMPNHAHGTIVLNDDSVGAGFPRPTPRPTSGAETGAGAETAPPRKRATLGQIVAYFKYQSAKRINELRNVPGLPVWQRNYYEHVIRNERELQAIRQYIRTNPLNWAEDRDNPQNVPPKSTDDYLHDAKLQ